MNLRGSLNLTATSRRVDRRPSNAFCRARTRGLIHIALAIAAGSEGATHSHTRRAVAEEISLEVV
jgi:hypothetical protein